MTVPANTTRSGRAGWFTDRPISVKIGAALAVLAIVAFGLTALAVQRIGTSPTPGTPCTATRSCRSTSWPGRSAPSRVTARATTSSASSTRPPAPTSTPS
ncbi:hypothetical protein [Blastococcus brunescens]|uniref:Uncharacterized protein n=1 Tax=Blastococcus brunescens TaxID=1564165 RepID=A0ABZ1AZZ9_9ACTN|nr:hypothetical protein [Blastococcus sp. BMG 8361]WRL63707.1 hypothetical protein U6N30_29310 [Blastococcus sp. BMG 8361]